MPRLALATYNPTPDHIDIPVFDHLLVAPLAARGITAESVAWDDPAVTWTDYDAVLLRSTWDYHQRVDEFVAWLDKLALLGVAVYNPAHIVRWNTDKHYLADLARHGATIIPTVFADGTRTLTDIMAETGWDDVVIKPRYGASAEGVRVFMSDNAADAPALTDMLVQPRLSQVMTDGEHSFVFLNGQYAYAALKRPAAGALFVQIEHGGSETIITPSSTLIAQAEVVMAAAVAHLDIASDDILYARVDGIILDGQLHVMELELIEPSLFIYLHAPAPELVADAVAARLGR
jgi:glutathione synthase/RimK-type ligase-like ATP-grasp enzyme